MSQPRKTLDARLPHDFVLRQLGRHFRSQGLPVRTLCPVCSDGVLTLHADEATGGHWAWCRGCGHAGDLVTGGPHLEAVDPRSYVVVCRTAIECASWGGARRVNL